MKDRFRDWNWYHKTIVTLLAAVAFGTFVRALLVIDTAFEIKGEATLNAPADTIWAWMISEDDRDKWQAGLIDVARLTGDTAERGTTRLVFWRKGNKRWQALETTMGVIPGRVLELMQSADQDTRWITLEIEPDATCRTRLVITEIIEPTAYNDRFWFFSEREHHEKRMAASLTALGRWMETAAPDCQE